MTDVASPARSGSVVSGAIAPLLAAAKAVRKRPAAALPSAPQVDVEFAAMLAEPAGSGTSRRPAGRGRAAAKAPGDVAAADSALTVPLAPPITVPLPKPQAPPDSRSPGLAVRVPDAARDAAALRTDPLAAGEAMAEEPQPLDLAVPTARDVPEAEAGTPPAAENRLEVRDHGRMMPDTAAIAPATGQGRKPGVDQLAAQSLRAASAMVPPLPPVAVASTAPPAVRRAGATPELTGDSRPRNLPAGAPTMLRPLATAMRFVAETGPGAAANVPFSFQSGLPGQTGSGGAEARPSAAPVAPLTAEAEGLQSESFADIAISTGEASGLEVRLLAGDAGSARRLSDAREMLERDLAQTGSEVEAIHVELRGPVMAIGDDRRRSGEAEPGGSGMREEGGGATDDRGGERQSARDQGAYEQGAHQRGAAAQGGAAGWHRLAQPTTAGSDRDARGGDAMPAGAEAAGMQRGTSAQGKVDRYG